LCGFFSSPKMGGKKRQEKKKSFAAG